MEITFAVSGVTAPLWLPPLAAAIISFFTSMIGISGAFLLMPFQMSVLGCAGPSASATNLVYNLVAIPGPAWRYRHEGRLWWRLALVISLGGAPGTLLGVWVRTHHLSDRNSFQLFAALVLGYLGLRLLADILGRRTQTADNDAVRPAFSVPLMAALSFLVGVVGTIYGIGGGSFMVPLCVTVFRLPIHAVAGATLTATLLTSLFALAAYQWLPSPVLAQPDWPLGLLFGLGGFVGGLAGARYQRLVSQRVLKAVLAALLVGLALRYGMSYATA
ncbi:MAG: sulfite exporter TauE/SafE family protein [Magnetococcales bacterium]|nr:sulfite exporter TauE/SafE family protein [Magnetococcales bacterium]MBF0157157.1 sulfite exporter TauE/SafE family protein [Magnetococcales bacterium]